MSEIRPDIFGKLGQFVPLAEADYDRLSEPDKQIYVRLVACDADMNFVAARLDENREQIKQAEKAVTDQQRFIAVNFPKRDFHSLWKETFGRK